MGVSRGYIIQRLMLLVVVVLGVVIITFIITRVIPAHPELLWAGPHASLKEIEKARKELMLDKPIYVQLYYYLINFFKGNWGVSWRTHKPVFDDIIYYLPATLELVIVAFIIAILLGIPLGILAAIKRGTWIDATIRVLSVIGASVPVFWLAMIAQLVFSTKLGILPGFKRVDDIIVLETGFKRITGFILLDSLIEKNFAVFTNALKHIILPALVLSVYPMGLSARMTRALMIEVLNEQHSRAIIAWGISERVALFKYALKNVISPVVASLGLSFGYTIVGAYLVELIFDWPGLGYYTAMALLSYDYPAIIGSITFVAIFYSTINMIVDLFHAMIDPRVRF